MIKAVGRGYGVVLAGVLLTALGTFHASQVRPINLEEMTERAETIFAGRCAEVRSVQHPPTGGMVTQATFEVHRAIKGKPGSTVTVKLFDGVSGVPQFREDEEVVLFLYGDSTLGLNSPVGFGQGKFSIVEGKQGRRIAVNAFGNRNLMRGISGEARVRLGAEYDLWKDKRELDSTALLDMAERLGN